MSNTEMMKIDGKKLKTLIKERTGKTISKVTDELGVGYQYFTMSLNDYNRLSYKTAKLIREKYGILPHEYAATSESEAEEPEAPTTTELAEEIVAGEQTEQTEAAEPEAETVEEPGEVEATVQIEKPDAETAAKNLVSYMRELAKAVVVLMPDEDETALLHGMLASASITAREYARKIVGSDTK